MPGVSLCSTFQPPNVRRKKDILMERKAVECHRVVVENVDVPGYSFQLDSAKYDAMRRALVRILPTKAPGFTQAAIRQAILAHLPESHFPAGAKANWWAKVVQLDLEAKGVINREATKPLRWHVRTANQRKR